VAEMGRVRNPAVRARQPMSLELAVGLRATDAPSPSVGIDVRRLPQPELQMPVLRGCPLTEPID